MAHRHLTHICSNKAVDARVVRIASTMFEFASCNVHASVRGMTDCLIFAFFKPIKDLYKLRLEGRRHVPYRAGRAEA